MNYTFDKKINIPFEEAVAKTMDSLKSEGFGILTDIDVKATFKKKLNIDFQNYRILGACNPPYSYKAIQAEPKIGTMLPCNVIVREIQDGIIEVSAVDPVASMMSVENPDLQKTATAIREKLQKAINKI